MGKNVKYVFGPYKYLEFRFQSLQIKIAFFSLHNIFLWHFDGQKKAMENFTETKNCDGKLYND